jgi:hypothetical protein
MLHYTNKTMFCIFKESLSSIISTKKKKNFEGSEFEDIRTPTIAYIPASIHEQYPRMYTSQTIKGNPTPEQQSRPDFLEKPQKPTYGRRLLSSSFREVLTVSLLDECRD